MNDLDELYLSIGSLRFTAGYIINLTKEDKNNVEDVLMERVSKKNLANTKDEDKFNFSVNFVEFDWRANFWHCNRFKCSFVSSWHGVGIQHRKPCKRNYYRFNKNVQKGRLHHCWWR